MTAPADRAAAGIAVVLVLLPIAYGRLQASPSEAAEALVLAGLLLGIAAVTAQALIQGTPPWPRAARPVAWLIPTLLIAAAALTAPCRPALTGVAAARLLIVLWMFATLTHAGPSGRRWLGIGLQTGAALVILMALVQAMGVERSDPSWLDRERYVHLTRRITSCLVNPNLLGAYLATMLPWLLADALEDQGPLRLPLAAGALATLLLSFSRGAWVAVAAGLAVMAVAAWRAKAWPGTPVRRFRVAIVCALVAAPLAPLIMERIGATRDPGELGRAQRITLLEGIFAYARASMAHGTGPGTFTTFYPLYRRHGGYYPRDAHGDLFQAACELGLPAALAYLAFLGWLLQSAARDQARWGLAGAVGAHVLAAVFVTANQYLALQVPLWALLALAWPREEPDYRLQTMRPESQAPPVPTAPPVSPVSPVPPVPPVPSARAETALVPGAPSPTRRVIAGLVALLGLIWACVGLLDGVLVGFCGQPGLIAAVRIAGRRDDLVFRLAESFLAQDDLAMARRAMAEAARINPLESRYRYELAGIEMSMGDSQAAWQSVERAVALDPWSEETLLLAGKIQIRRGDLPGAEVTLERASRTNEQYLSINAEVYRPVLALLAAVQARRGRQAQAEATRERFLRAFGRAP